MEIKKVQDVYEINDTFNDKSVQGQCSVGPDNGVSINLSIGDDLVYYNVFYSQDSCGANVSLKTFDPDIIKYITDIASTIINY